MNMAKSDKMINKNANKMNTLGKMEAGRIVLFRIRMLCREGRPGPVAPEIGEQEHEQAHGQGNAQHHGHTDDELLTLFGAEFLFDPEIELVGLALVFLRGHFCGIGQSLHALGHGVDEIGHAPDEGDAENGVLVFGGLDGLHLGDDAFGTADDDGLLVHAPHKDALDEGLTADGGAEAAAGGVVFLHRFAFLR